MKIEIEALKSLKLSQIQKTKILTILGKDPRKKITISNKNQILSIILKRN